MSEKLASIEEAFANGSPPEEVIQRIEALHQEVMHDPELRMNFEKEVLNVAQGLYLPYIFWIYLAAFLQDKESYRPFLEYILQVFAQQPSNPFIEKRLRPLLYVYFSEESPFYLDRLWDYFSRYANADKYSFMDKTRSLIAKNPATVEIFREKFRLLSAYMPDFEALALPLAQIRESLARSSSEPLSE
ncbi:MAG: hypothetical protein RMJ66_03580 [Bacteroidia bacterium]|nr:hypothetical protein [Bacteroidia bacterium]MDW8134128.1 hypothetical protein [Bacteroidia bacterium]